MKLTPLAFLLLAASSTVMAQAPAKNTPAQRTPTLQVAPPAGQTSAEAPAQAAPAAAPAAPTAAAATNPFTGKALTVEQIQLQLEQAKLQTQTLEEMLKQTNIQEELKNVPLRKAVEASQARTNIKKEENAQAGIDQAAKAAADDRAARSAASKPSTTKKSTGKSEKVSEAPVQPVAPPPPPRPTLLSVIDVGGSKSVVLDFSGATLVVADGDMTPVGPVRVVDASSANVGGEVYKVRGNTLSRFVVSDPKVDPNAKLGSSSTTPFQAAGAPSGASGLPPLPAAAAAAAGQQAPRSAVSTTMLPPLQLPPGLTSLPAPK